MKLMELYDEIKNPLNDPDVIEVIIDKYLVCSREVMVFYSKIAQSSKKEHTKGVCLTKDRDQYFSMIFNKWKSQIVNMKKEQFIKNYHERNYDIDFLELREFLMKFSDVNTFEEVQNFSQGKFEDNEINDAIKKYSWGSYDKDFTNIHSERVTSFQKVNKNIDHRLYINSESINTYSILNLLTEKFNKREIPYCYKFDPVGDRDETIVIYCSTENLNANIEILKEIKKENPKLISLIKRPPILTGIIDGWFGYGSEPVLPDGRRSSFNLLRSEVIVPALDKAIKEWISSHLNSTIEYNGSVIPFQEYIKLKLTDSTLQMMINRYQYKVDFEKKCNKEKTMDFIIKKVMDDLGYNEQDLKLDSFKQKIYNSISIKLPEVLDSYFNDSYENIKSIIVGLDNNKKESINRYSFVNLLTHDTIENNRNNPLFIEMMKKNININFKEIGINTDKCCFDNHAIEKMKSEDAKNLSQEDESTVLDKTIKINIKTYITDDNNFFGIIIDDYKSLVFNLNKKTDIEEIKSLLEYFKFNKSTISLSVEDFNKICTTRTKNN